MSLSCTVLDARDRVVIYSTTQLRDVLWDAIYQVEDLHTSDVTNIRLWVPPDQVGVGEPGKDHSQGWGVGHWKGCREWAHTKGRKTFKVLCVSSAFICTYLQILWWLSASQHGC